MAATAATTASAAATMNHARRYHLRFAARGSGPCGCDIDCDIGNTAPAGPAHRPFPASTLMAATGRGRRFENGSRLLRTHCAVIKPWPSGTSVDSQAGRRRSSGASGSVLPLRGEREHTSGDARAPGPSRSNPRTRRPRLAGPAFLGAPPRQSRTCGTARSLQYRVQTPPSTALGSLWPRAQPIRPARAPHRHRAHHGRRALPARPKRRTAPCGNPDDLAVSDRGDQPADTHE